jgi:Carboxypeptidase regulatory-like domain/Alginate export
MRASSFAAVIAAVLLLAGPVSAQEQRGVIEGVVKDSSGAVLPGATVEVHTPSGVALTTITDAQGVYRFPSVAPGTYVVNARLQGVGTGEVKDVVVGLGQLKKVDITLGPVPPPPQPEARTMGLPSKLQWTFNFDAGWGNFGFGNSLFNNPKEPGVDENLSDQWFEGYVKPALSGAYTLANSSEIYGKASAVGERTYGSVPEAFGQDVSSFEPEDLYIGWRSGEALTLGENAVDFRIGRSQYRLGHGMLVYDGGAEGGTRGGYWTNARRAFQFAAIGRLVLAPHTVELFYLDKDELPEGDSGSRLWGANYEFAPGEHSTFGVTWMRTFSDIAVRPDRDGMNVLNLRAYTAPVPNLPNLSFEFEYALEDNGDVIDSNAWTIQAAYELSEVVWKPKFSYRYAFFQGDDPTTPTNEGFDPLFLGFYDWGQWWQGEIAGEYFLSNSNLISNLFRVQVTPIDAIGTGLLFFQFSLDQPGSFAPNVTDTDVAFEIDWYTDWKINKNFTTSIVFAYADPGKAVQQAFDRTKNFAYGMLYVAYSF